MNLKSSASLVLAVLICVAVIQSGVFWNNSNSNKDSLQGVFQSWKNEYGVSFSLQEEAYRFEVFRKNQIAIQLHNSNPSRTYDMGVNIFSHLTHEEFSEKYLKTAVQQNRLRTQQNELSSLRILEDVDWQVLGKVSPVKNQGNCDAGYAFCSVSLVESRLLMKGQKSLLSEQQVVDCSADYTTFGCSGGSRAGTLKFAKQKGLVQQTGYPFLGTKGSCKNSTGDTKIDFEILQSNGCQQMKNNLYKTPMTIAVNAQTWQSYKSGIYNGCTSTQVNHDVFLVGVSTSSWRVKNSWGIRWGEYGYIRLALGDTCGICQKTGFGIKI